MSMDFSHGSSHGSSLATDCSVDEPIRLKLTCENCVRAKVKCTGPPGPCERCSGWRGLDCVFVEEKKRGRPRVPEEVKKGIDDAGNKAIKLINSHGAPQDTDEKGKTKKQSGLVKHGKLTCITTDCWSRVTSSAEEIKTYDLVGYPCEGLSTEQARVVEIFFSLYKNHASSRTCCQAWFSRQLNKIAGMLKAAKSYTAMASIFEWMNKHEILVAPVAPPEKKPFRDGDSGMMIPPITTAKGPMLADGIMVQSHGEHEPIPSDPRCACIRISYTRDEICSVHTSERFVEIFGRDASYFTSYLDTLYGGILPWGADIFANLFMKPMDTILLIRVLAYRFSRQPRMMDTKQPVTRTVQTSHLFPCMTADGSYVDCVIRMEHIENVSAEGVEVSVRASFEPYVLPPPVLCDFRPSKSPQDQDIPLVHASPDSYESESGAFEQALEAPSLQDESCDLWVEDLLKWVDEPERL